jgi:hypothetical protein
VYLWPGPVAGTMNLRARSLLSAYASYSALNTHHVTFTSTQQHVRDNVYDEGDGRPDISLREMLVHSETSRQRTCFSAGPTIICFDADENDPGKLHSALKPCRTYDDDDQLLPHSLHCELGLSNVYDRRGALGSSNAKLPIFSRLVC